MTLNDTTNMQKFFIYFTLYPNFEEINIFKVIQQLILFKAQFRSFCIVLECFVPRKLLFVNLVANKFLQKLSKNLEFVRLDENFGNLNVCN